VPVMAGAIETSVKIAQFADVPLRERNVTTQHYGLIYNKTTKIYFTAVAASSTLVFHSSL